MSRALRPGHVVRIDFRGTEGSEPQGERWAIVVDDGAVQGLATVLVVPLTGELRRQSQPAGVLVRGSASGLPHDSVAQSHLVFPASTDRIVGEPVGQVPDTTLRKIRLILADLLGIGADTFAD